MAGDTLTVVESEARAREVASYRQEKATAKRTTSAPASLENMFSALAAKRPFFEYPVVIRADVQGSTEAIVNALGKISNDEIKVRVLQSGVGAITESDVSLAQAAARRSSVSTSAPTPRRARCLTPQVRMKYFDVIYHLTEDVAKEMAESGGRNGSNTWSAAPRSRTCSRPARRTRQRACCGRGAYQEGLFARLTRDDCHRLETTIASLRRFKDDVAEVVRASNACGSGRYQRYQAGRPPRSVRGGRARTDAVSVAPGTVRARQFSSRVREGGVMP